MSGKNELHLVGTLLLGAALGASLYTNSNISACIFGFFFLIACISLMDGD